MPTLKDYEVLKKENEFLDYKYKELEKERDKIRNDFEILLKELSERKVIQSWQYNGEYNYEYSEDYKSNRDWQRRTKELEEELEKEKHVNEYIKARFVICDTCTPEEKENCLMYITKECKGERCKQIIDLEQLLDKATEEGVIR